MHKILTGIKIKKEIREFRKNIEAELGMDTRQAAIKMMSEITKGNGSITSYSAFSKLVGIHRTMLHRYEGGALPSFENSLEIIDACDTISKMKSVWGLFIKKWDTNFNIKLLNRIIYDPNVIEIVESGKYSYEEKIEKLVRYSLKKTVTLMEK